MAIHLVEPESGGRISGGFRYNHCLAESLPALALTATPLARVGDALALLALSASDWLFADSLFLERATFQPFLEARRRSACRLGLVLHALPSFVKCAALGDERRLLGARPSAEEIELLEALDLVICPGPYLPRIFSEAHCHVRTLVCQPGTELPGALPSRVPGPQVRLLTVAAVTRGKGHLESARALAGCRQQAWSWTLVGALDRDPVFVQELRALLQRSDLAERVALMAQLDSRATQDHYRASDLFLLTSYTENHPLVLLEAQAHGLPVVAFDVGGISDIVTSEWDGLLVPPFDAPALEATLGRLIEDGSLRASLGKRARQAASRRPTWAESGALLERALALPP